ncbi:NYN domain-containing protein, partial [Staphylococcus epidermidis]|uniref:NYN domain-containing protein n=1 Tax=Staphylococcus epidermidis TaxID=1282 RepID=UPI001642632D
LTTLAKHNLQEPTHQLLHTIPNYNPLIPHQILSLFHPYQHSRIQTQYFYHPLKTIFTKQKQTPHTFIQPYLYQLYNKHTTHITLLTSDMTEQHA